MPYQSIACQGKRELDGLALFLNNCFFFATLKSVSPSNVHKQELKSMLIASSHEILILEYSQIKARATI